VAIFLFALAVKESSFRRAGLAMLLLCIGKLAALDFWGLQSLEKILTVIFIALAVIGISLLYNANNERFRQYL
jgi:hypothetical protein